MPLQIEIARQGDDRDWRRPDRWGHIAILQVQDDGIRLPSLGKTRLERIPGVVLAHEQIAGRRDIKGVNVRGTPSPKVGPANASSTAAKSPSSLATFTSNRARSWRSLEKIVVPLVTEQGWESI